MNQALRKTKLAMKYIFDKYQRNIYTDKYLSGNRLDLLFSYTNIGSGKVKDYLYEIEKDQYISDAHTRRAYHFSYRPIPPIRCVGLYILVREYEPSIVVETGVEHGFSGSYILAAMERNGHGCLHSIDVPSPNLPKSRGAGWIIPPDCRHRWNLTVGNTLDKLNPLLDNIDSPDIFYHDSYHKYPLMSYEFERALESMSDGIICGDDVNRNHAFLELCSEVDGTVNIDRPFKIGGKGVFGFTYVGELQDDGIKSANDC